jgi:hypothetical protein
MEKIKKIWLEMDKKKRVMSAILAFFILVGIIFFFNSPQRLVERRNSQRRAAVFSILTAVYDYSLEKKDILDKLSLDQKEICGVKSDCGEFISINVLVDQKFLNSIPVDPKNTNKKGSGYKISKSENGRITVLAPLAENGAKISSTR